MAKQLAINVKPDKHTIRYRGYGVTKMNDKIVLVRSTPNGVEIKHTGCDFLYEFKAMCNRNKKPRKKL